MTEEEKKAAEELQAAKDKEIADAKAKEEDTPKYTDKQLNDLIAKNAGKAISKAETDILLAAGVTTKEELAELKKLRESQMSESEKSQARIKELEAADATTKKEIDAAKAETAALKAGVSPDKSEKVMKLALSGVYEGDTIEEKVKSVLTEFPDFIKTGTDGKAFGNGTESKTKNAEDDLREKIFKNVGLSIKK